MDRILKSTDELLFGMCCVSSTRDTSEFQHLRQIPGPAEPPFGREDEVWFKRKAPPPPALRRGVSSGSPRKQPVVINAKPLKASQSKNGQFRGVVADMYVVEGYEAHNELLVDHVEGAKRLAIRNCNHCTVHVTADVTHLIVDGTKHTQITVLGCRSVEVAKSMWLQIDFRQHHGLDPSVHLMDCLDVTFCLPSGMDAADMAPKVHATRSTEVVVKSADGTPLKVS